MLYSHCYHIFLAIEKKNTYNIFMNFTKNRFIQLDNKAQNKKCAFLLKEIYTAFLEKKDFSHLLKRYNQFAHWAGFIPIKAIDPKDLSNLYHQHLHEAHLNLKEHNLLPSLRTGDHLAKEEFGSIAIYLDNLRSAYNVGSILRTTEALRLGTVYFAKNTPDQLHPKVMKTSMNTADIIPCKKQFSIEELPRPFIGLDTSDQAIPLSEYIFPATFTLILGNEEYGISNEMLSQVDYLVEIPLVGCKNSINVACAFSIAAFSIFQQKS